MRQRRYCMYSSIACVSVSRLILSAVFTLIDLPQPTSNVLSSFQQRLQRYNSGRSLQTTQQHKTPAAVCKPHNNTQLRPQSANHLSTYNSGHSLQTTQTHTTPAVVCKPLEPIQLRPQSANYTTTYNSGHTLQTTRTHTTPAAVYQLLEHIKF